MLGTSRQFDGKVHPALATEAVEAYRFLKQATTAAEDYKVNYADAGEKPLGISVAEAASSEGVGVAVSGFGLLYVDANSVNIAAGDPIKATADGVGVKAGDGDAYAAIALEPATADGAIIRVLIQQVNSCSVGGATNSTNSITLTAAQLSGKVYTLIASYAGAVALAIPGAATVTTGTRFCLKKTGSAGAVTITPAAGTISGGATHAACDAQNDTAEWVAIGTDWVLIDSTIA
jgi:hypothetical protein